MRISDWSSDVCSSDLDEKILVELPKFNKLIDELTSRADKWVFIFKNLHLLTEPIFTYDPKFKRLFQITDYLNQPEEDRKMIIDRERDLRNIEKEWTKNAMQKGIEKGIEQGIEKGIEQGKASFVKSLLENTDFGDERIASIAAINVGRVRSLRAEMLIH